MRKTFPSAPSDDGIRERILEVAEDEFRRHRLTHVSMDELAARLGMSKKTIYKHFPSKKALLQAFARRTMHRVEVGIDAVLESDKPSLEKVTGLLGVVGTQMLHFSREMATDLARLEPSLWKEIEAFRRGMLITKILPLLRLAKQEGMMRPELRPELFFLVLLNSVEGIINPRMLAEQSFSTEEAFTGIFQILFRGALTPDASEQFRVSFIVPTFTA